MGQDHTIGGIQRYIFGLIDVFQEKYKIIIIQKSSLDFKKSFKNHLVYGFKTSKRNFAKELYSKIENHLNDQDIIIWASDRISTKINHKKVISIQHGITFDFLDYDNIYFGSILKKSRFLSYVYRLFQYKNAIKYFNTSPKVVCVDYNYINWVRTVMPRMLTLKATVIPNFAKITGSFIPTKININEINIIFARRFVKYRGVYIMAKIIEDLIKKRPNLKFSIYGEGPKENYLIHKFKLYDNVKISKYKLTDLDGIYDGHQISIIPTFGSEGTSLSLLESMEAGCVPIASNVGGITNIIIDGFNGFLVNPNHKEFIKKIEFLLNHPNKLNEIRLNANKTISDGFNFKIWSSKWEDVINEVSKN